MDRVVECLDAVLDVNTAARETCADALIEAINLMDASTMDHRPGA
jgi:hypothetical protein